MPGRETRGHIGARQQWRGPGLSPVPQEVNTGNTTQSERKLALIGRVGIKIPPVCKHSSRTGILGGERQVTGPVCPGLLTLVWPNSDHTSPVSKHSLGKVSCFPQESGNILEAKGKKESPVCFISWQVSFWEVMGDVVYQPPRPLHPSSH